MPQKTKSRHSLGQSATMPAPVGAQFSICAASPDEGALPIGDTERLTSAMPRVYGKATGVLPSGPGCCLFPFSSRQERTDEPKDHFETY